MSRSTEHANILREENIVLGQPAEPYEDAIRRCGRMLVDGGYVTERYVEGMLARDRELSTAIGNHIAIPHGTNDYKQYIKSTGIVVVTYPEGISWNGTVVHLVIGIAAIGEAHLDILGNVVDNLETEEDVLHLVEHGDMETIRAVFYDKGETSP